MHAGCQKPWMTPCSPSYTFGLLYRIRFTA
jgi:hypothetical protein